MGRKFGPSLITGVARLNGESVGVIANDCMYYAGAMTASAAQKLRRFADFCNSFHLPIISFVDEPGFMIALTARRREPFVSAQRRLRRFCNRACLGPVCKC